MQEQKLRAQQAQQDAVGDSTEIVTKPLFAFGGFGSKSSKTSEVEEVEEKTTGVSVLGGIFGSQKSKKRGTTTPVLLAILLTTPKGLQTSRGIRRAAPYQRMVSTPR